MKIPRWWPRALVAALLLGLAVRWTVRDAVPVVATFYYATPPAVLAAAAAAGCAVAVHRKSRRLCAAFAAILAAAGTEVVTSSCFAASQGPPGSVRGLFWNVLGGRRGWDEVARTLREADPDVAWLVECRSDDGRADAAFAQALPEHTLLRQEGGLVVFVRGEAQAVEYRWLPGAGRVSVERIVVRGRTFHAVHVDVASNPLRDRRPAFAMLDEMMAPYVAGPLVVAGDFNTPRESVRFDAWRGPLVHAFEAAGDGWAPTWPVPFPVLALDHVWVSRSLTVRSCKHLWTAHSDHRPVTFTFD